MFELEIITSKNKIEIRDNYNKVKNIFTECEHPKRNFVCFGFYGSIEINDCVYVIFIIKRTSKEHFRDCEVFEISEVDVIQIKGPLNKYKRKVEELKLFFTIPGIYYSSYPLYQESSIGLSDGIDFIFNYTPLKSFEKHCPELNEYTVKCIQGYYGLREEENHKLYLISRRSWRRTGARYFSRGSCSTGYVSNFVETEMFLFQNGVLNSFLQVRGSIPLVWSHKVYFKYNPELIIHKENYFIESNNILKRKYNDVFYLNLIKNKAYEKPIHELFTINLMFNKCSYLHFDVHTKGSLAKEKVHNEFISNIEEVNAKNGFSNQENKQKGIIRTNCIDCLDRTNLCQFLISQNNLYKMCEDETKTSIDNILKMHRSLWHENGNCLSLQYSGTFALKSHLVGGYNKSIVGDLQDLTKSIKRYFINRFKHGKLQNCYDILTLDNLNKCKKRLREKNSLIGSSILFISVFILLISIYIGFKKDFGPEDGFVFLSFIIFILSFFRDYPEYEDDFGNIIDL